MNAASGSSLPHIVRLSFVPVGTDFLLLSASVDDGSGNLLSVDVLLSELSSKLLTEHGKAVLGKSALDPRFSGFISTKALAASWTTQGGPYSGENLLLAMDRIIRRRAAIQKKFSKAFLKHRPGFLPPRLFFREQMLGTRLACDSVSLPEDP